jgi:hypothetical protein
MDNDTRSELDYIRELAEDIQSNEQLLEAFQYDKINEALYLLQKINGRSAKSGISGILDIVGRLLHSNYNIGAEYVHNIAGAVELLQSVDSLLETKPRYKSTITD